MRIFFISNFTILFASILFARPLVYTDYEYYNIYPTNKHNLEESMDSASPLLSFGSIRHATVNWKINYSYKREIKKGICSISEVKTKVNILYVVPKIAKTHKSPSGTKKVFNRYYVVLKKSLRKHSNLAVLAANEIEEKLVKIKPLNNDCELIKKDAKKLANSIIQKYKKKNKDFEIRTYEGFLEGVEAEKLL